MLGGSELGPDSTRKMEEKGDNFSLVLRNVDEADLGEYKCVAINSVGEAEATVRLSGE